MVVMLRTCVTIKNTFKWVNFIVCELYLNKIYSKR